jgi:Plasmid maintenance system antidote protein
MALRLSRAFDTTPDFWLNLQKIMTYGTLKRLQKNGKKLNQFHYTYFTLKYHLTTLEPDNLSSYVSSC